MKIIKVDDFRKTNASLLFESGASMKDVAKILGHKSTKNTTDIYVKVTPTEHKMKHLILSQGTWRFKNSIQYGIQNLHYFF